MHPLSSEATFDALRSATKLERNFRKDVPLKVCKFQVLASSALKEMGNQRTVDWLPLDAVNDRRMDCTPITVQNGAHVVERSGQATTAR
jgi:hypothetical protein